MEGEAALGVVEVSAVLPSRFRGHAVHFAAAVESL
jgi:hypothetical protein